MGGGIQIGSQIGCGNLRDTLSDLGRPLRCCKTMCEVIATDLDWPGSDARFLTILGAILDVEIGDTLCDVDKGDCWTPPGGK